MLKRKAVIYTVGAAAVLSGLIYFASKLIQKSKSPFQRKIALIKKKIDKKIKNNPSLFHFKYTMEINKAYRVPFLILLSQNYSKKPIGEIKVSDPFTAPYESNLFVTELTDTHDLLLNKYVVTKGRTLVIPKAFEEQSKGVSIQGIPLIRFGGNIPRH